jgi:hypothetical protein
MNDDRITKLPKWAQQKIQRLERDLVWHQAKFEDTLRDPAGCLVRIGDVALPDDVRITYRTGPGKDEELTIRRKGGDLMVAAKRGHPVVIPVASNVLKLRMIHDSDRKYLEWQDLYRKYIECA